MKLLVARMITPLAAALAVALVGGMVARAPADSVTAVAPVVTDAVWKPRPFLRWQLQFATSPIDASVDADVYKIDLFDNDAAVVADLKEKGKRVVCYLNAGAWESWRADADRYPRAAIGRAYSGWPGERWLDIRRIDLIGPVIAARLDLCKAKGFDGVMLDNMDSYNQKTGFPLKPADQLRFSIWVAIEARNRGLAVGINNNPEQATSLAPYFDWALAESCFSQGWCASLRPFVDSGKAVVVIEYVEDPKRLNAWCEQALALRMSLLRKKRELDSFREDCSHLEIGDRFRFR